jgi:nucleotide-binding universal stress UspA family protein
VQVDHSSRRQGPPPCILPPVLSPGTDQLREEPRRTSPGAVAAGMIAATLGAEGGERKEGQSMFKTIVVGTDGSETATEAVRQALALASSIGASVQIVSAYEPVPAGRLREERRDAPEDLQWAINPREDVEATLAEAAEIAADAGVETNTWYRRGDPADAILDVAEEHHADLIVVGNKGMTGAKRFLLGSVPNRVSHHAPCSVLIIRTT